MIYLLMSTSLRIFVGTYNLAEQEIPIKSLISWLKPEQIDTVCDLYSIGVQEGPKKCCFSPMQAKFRKQWETNLLQVLGDNFEILHTASFGVQHLAILIKKSLKQFVTDKVIDFTVCVRILSRKRRTKGAIIICLCYRELKLAFITSHLRYGISKVPRQEDFVKIFKFFSKRNPWKNQDGNQFIFWFGDLNSRFDNLSFDQINMEITSENVNFTQLLLNDQLHNELKIGGPMFQGFEEGEIKFLPTYKFKIGFPERDNRRNPGYTDRILFHKSTQNLIRIIKYDSVPSVCSSDHKPVYGIFEIGQGPSPGEDKESSLQPSKQKKSSVSMK